MLKSRGENLCLRDFEYAGIASRRSARMEFWCDELHLYCRARLVAVKRWHNAVASVEHVYVFTVGLDALVRIVGQRICTV